MKGHHMKGHKLNHSLPPSSFSLSSDGKGMAIVGWEIDQVRRTPQGDVSVPISASYNHHYNAQVPFYDAFKTILITPFNAD